jgi:hypothetical protein
LKLAALNDLETLKDMQAAFERARAARPDAASEHRYVVAGNGVRLRIVGRELAQEITPALEHMKNGATSGQFGLTIDIWDQMETGVGDIDTSSSDGEEVVGLLTASPDKLEIVEDRAYSKMWFDRRADRIVGYARSHGTLFVDERARPLTRLLSIWLNDRKVQMIHSGLVSWQGCGVLFVGPGGSGKTTSSTACLRDGFGFLGDDWIGLEEAADGSFIGHGLYGSCLVTPKHLTRFADLAPYAGAANHSFEDKSVVYLSHIYPERIEQRVTIGVVALPRVVGRGETSFRPASQAEALLALAPSSVMFLPGASARSLDKLGKLVECVPCYWLELGRDVDRIPDAVRRMMAAAEHP